ncbi:hypothetical protein COV04_02550 [Candidatus Uhrbacteria bacterium CG10_big_fil_rev_8_21_14_0_10_48_11]|uniref:Glycosyl transferase family 1 domain-containing protein n=1 Tax=Candidatus Uhrbacteria bacterium CG10_big_fil_rev_8_21_14_0_10_48_11 TaxID=1975037 RepID=A0A2M8LEC4_9BACT|nr:MAG: hypothetical protein COV04_02550 [Candidatus Uhrbacteria bacterium CG10_big_fil_rev_8_21_14_0_10_48_11]
MYNHYHRKGYSMNEMFTLFTIDFPPDRGGVGRMYEALACALAPQLRVYAPLPKNENDTELPFSIVRQPLLAEAGLLKWRKLFWVLLLNKEKGREHELFIAGQVLPIGTALWAASFFKHIRYAVFVHGMDITVAAKVVRRRWLIRRILKRADVVLAANQFIEKKVIALGISRNKIAVIYPIVEVESSREQKEEARERLHVGHGYALLTICRLVERKGVQLVIDALETVWKVLPEVTYYVIGKGSFEEQLKKFASKTSHPDRIVFLGEVDDRTARSWRIAADIFILTPLTLKNGDTEGVGIALLEASAAGLPVIGSRHGGVPEGMEDGVSGSLIAEEDTKALGEQILSLLQNAGKRRAMGSAGQQLVKNRFGQERVVNTFLSAVKKND